MDDITTPTPHPDRARTELTSIGRFSSLTRISVRMLRHYDEHGVLAPAHIDPGTGYRSYAVSQLPEAMMIRHLRDVGFSVSSIAAVLAARGTDAFAQALRLRRLELVDDTRAAQQRLTLIEHMLNDLQESDMTDPITVRRAELPAMTIVALRGTVPSYSDEGQLWACFMPELQRQGVRPIGPGGSLEHDATYMEANPDLSVWVPVAAGTTAESPLTVHELPRQNVVVASVVGSYSQIAEAHARIGTFMSEEGLTDARAASGDDVAGRIVNIYLTDPSRTPEAENVTEVYRPVR